MYALKGCNSRELRLFEIRTWNLTTNVGFITLKGKQLLTRKTFCYRIRSFNSLLGIRTEGI